MPAPARSTSSAPPFAKGSIIWEKKGPLPVWAWALIVLGLVLAVVMWRRNKGQAESQTAATGLDNSALPGTQKAPYIFVVPQVGQQPAPPGNKRPSPLDMPPRNPGPLPPRRRPDPETPPPAPPGGGRDTPPSTPPTPAPRPEVPQYLSVPGMTNLYNWSQEIEGQYGLTSPLFDIIRGQGPLEWKPAGWGGADPQYGKVPVFSSATTVKVR